MSDTDINLRDYVRRRIIEELQARGHQKLIDKARDLGVDLANDILMEVCCDLGSELNVWALDRRVPKEWRLDKLIENKKWRSYAVLTFVWAALDELNHIVFGDDYCHLHHIFYEYAPPIPIETLIHYAEHEVQWRENSVRVLEGQTRGRPEKLVKIIKRIQWWRERIFLLRIAQEVKVMARAAKDVA